MATRERPVDSGRERGRDLIRKIGKEIRLARRNGGLSVQSVAGEVGISAMDMSRIERGLAPWVSLTLLATICAVVGLDLSAKTYPGGQPLRDARHARLLARFRNLLHPSLRWMTEVPLPSERDQRSWDGVVVGPGWYYGTEAETNPIDGQALCRRLQLKRRDGGVSGVILLLPDTRQTRAFRREFADLLVADYPVSGRRALASLAEGSEPGGGAIVVL
jgi:transcriptional regulator with XRE-family HTH domain